MYQFTFTVKHDTGKAKISVLAVDEQTAINTLLASERCPARAIVKTTAREVLYNVYKIGRKYGMAGRRKVLRRGVDLETARAVVNSYPDSSRSMIVFTRQPKFS